ncbi:Tn3 family transposase [Streptomyces atratus]|uniref:Tn3 family transposase n=1 Tax=Streptomyces TaxID=1883 RepID=UPI0037BD9A29
MVRWPRLTRGTPGLLGFDLMPRIRNWKDLAFYRPSKQTEETAGLVRADTMAACSAFSARSPHLSPTPGGCISSSRVRSTACGCTSPRTLRGCPWSSLCPSGCGSASRTAG